MICWIEIGGQKGRIEVTLDWPDATRASVPTLRQRFFHGVAAAVTILAEFGRACGDFGQGAARAYNGASEQCYKHPWSPQPHAFAKAFLPRRIGNLFEQDRVAYRHNFVHFASMQALAMGCQFPFSGRFALPGLLVVLALFPDQFLFAGSLLDATSLVVMLGVGCAALPVHLALEAAHGLLVGSQFLAED